MARSLGQGDGRYEIWIPCSRPSTCPCWKRTSGWIVSEGGENHFTDECVFAGLGRACPSRVCGETREGYCVAYTFRHYSQGSALQGQGALLLHVWFLCLCMNICFPASLSETRRVAASAGTSSCAVCPAGSYTNATGGFCSLKCFRRQEKPFSPQIRVGARDCKSFQIPTLLSPPLLPPYLLPSLNLIC